MESGLNVMNLFMESYIVSNTLHYRVMSRLNVMNLYFVCRSSIFLRYMRRLIFEKKSGHVDSRYSIFPVQSKRDVYQEFCTSFVRKNWCSTTIMTNYLTLYSHNNSERRTVQIQVCVCIIFRCFDLYLYMCILELWFCSQIWCSHYCTYNNS